MILESYYLALTLGILHAFEPGHGKTAIAMFSITQNIKLKQIFTLIISIFISHSLMLIGLAILLNTVLRGVNEELLYGIIALIGSGILFFIGYNLFPRRKMHSVHCNCALHQSKIEANRNTLQPFVKNNSSVPLINLPYNMYEEDEKNTLKMARWIGVSSGLIPCPTAVASFIAAGIRGDIGEGIICVILFSLGIVFALTGIIFFSKYFGAKLVNRMVKESNFRYRFQALASVLVILAGFYSLFSIASKYIYSGHYRIFL